MGNTTPPLGGVNKSVGNFEGRPYPGEQERPTIGREDPAASECAPSTNPDAKATGQSPL